VLRLTDAHDAGPLVGRHPYDGYVVECGPGPGDALAVCTPAAASRHFHEPDAQPEGYPVPGKGQDLIAQEGVRHAPGAVRSVGPLVDLQRDTDYEDFSFLA
jgi:hypothetical protein